MEMDFNFFYLRQKINNNDFNSVHEILLENLKLLNQPGLRSAHVQDNLKVFLNQDNKEEAEISSTNKLKEIQWKNGLLSSIIFCRIKINTRKEILKLLIQNGLDVGNRNEHGENLLLQFIHGFVEKNDSDAAEIAEVLIDSGVKVNEVDKENFSPLLRAIDSGNIELISLLIRKGANVNERNGGTLLHYVVENEGLVALLLSNGAKINAKDDDGWTALHTACLHRNEQVIGLLLRKGADISAMDKFGATPFFQLQPGRDGYDRSVFTMIKAFSKLNFENLPVCKNDMQFIQESTRNQERFKSCTNELEQMKNVKFYSVYSYYSVLKMSKRVRKLANLIKNDEFLNEFERNLHKFPLYERELEEILKEATKVKNDSQIIEFRLKSIFGDFFPDLIMRQLARDLTVNDLPVQFD